MPFQIIVIVHSVNICLTLTGARNDLGIRDKMVMRRMSVPSLS